MNLDIFPNGGLKIQKKGYGREEQKKLSSELEQVTRWPYLIANRAPSTHKSDLPVEATLSIHSPADSKEVGKEIPTARVNTYSTLP